MLTLLLVMVLGISWAFAVDSRTNCPYCGAPAHFTGERGNNWSHTWDVYECSNGHRYDVFTN